MVGFPRKSTWETFYNMSTKADFWLRVWLTSSVHFELTRKTSWSISPNPNFEPPFYRLFRHILFHWRSSFEWYHCLINWVFTCRFVTIHEGLKRMVYYWLYFAQFIVSRTASAQKGGVVHEMNKSGDLKETIPRDSVRYRDIPVSAISFPIIRETW